MKQGSRSFKLATQLDLVPKLKERTEACLRSTIHHHGAVLGLEQGELHEMFQEVGVPPPE
jgi:hypothetical protein